MILPLWKRTVNDKLRLFSGRQSTFRLCGIIDAKNKSPCDSLYAINEAAGQSANRKKNRKKYIQRSGGARGSFLSCVVLIRYDVNKSQTCALDSWVLPWSLCRWLKSLWIGRRPYRSTVAVRLSCLHIQRSWRLLPLPSLPECTHPEKSRGQKNMIYAH